jgi:signal transduction histidine kinase
LPAKDFLPKINKQVDRLEGIIDDLLDISKIQSGKLDFHFEKISLHQLINESVESVYTQNHIIHIENTIEDIVAVADRQKLMQVMVNLITNAVKYSAAGTTISINVFVFGDEIQVAVTDEGIGMPAEYLDKIFNQFYRISPGDHQAKGMGLGLFIAKEIMEAHSGKIWVESEVNKGSSFHISFPLERRL